MLQGNKAFAGLAHPRTATRTRENTTPARFEDFADELARAYETL
jgi:hypothetical protein